MATTATSADMMERLLEDVDRIEADARRLAGALSARQLEWAPPDGGWTVGQVFEHLLISDRSYVERMRPLIERARAGAVGAGGTAWRSSLAGRFLVKSLSPTSARKLPAPRIYRPGPAPRPDVVEQYLRSLDALRALIRDARGIDLSRLRMGSPVSSLIRVNVGDGFAIMVVHAQRHLGQVERIIASPGFPGA